MKLRIYTNTMLQTLNISRQFCDYYQSNGYLFLPGSSLLHPSVPMSFVMSAGLVQIETALNNKIDLQGDRFSLVQKCFRYFDVAQVGQDSSHLSLFEMPGAFFFTDGGNETTIKHMWHVVTQVLGVDKAHLWVTYFAGGYVSGHSINTDSETLQAWRQLDIPYERLVPLGVDDNYWKQGGGIDGQERYRKCGPNTEIFYDFGPHLKCSSDCRPGCKCGRFMEFANSLFVRHEIDEQTGTVHKLNRPFTETVIGTERVAMILQGKVTIFDIDVISPIIALLRTNNQASQIEVNAARKSENVIVDHLRAIVHLVADGAPPAGKNGRQRLMKILIRETLTHALLLNFDICDQLDKLLLKVWELSEMPHEQAVTLKKVKKYFFQEHGRFLEVQNRGKKKLQKYIRENNGQTLSGDQLVFLEKQYGLPNELSQLYLTKLGLPFNYDGYTMALQNWKVS